MEYETYESYETYETDAAYDDIYAGNSKEKVGKRKLSQLGCEIHEIEGTESTPVKK